MPTLNLTDNEYNLVRQAVGNLNDFHVDTMFENISSVDLFARSPITVNPSNLAPLRDELRDLIDMHVTLRTLLSKFNISTNESGYSL